MDFRFFGQNIEKTCESCHFGQRSSNVSMILCEKKGVASLNFLCKKHKYNPLRRRPKEQADAFEFFSNRYNLEDFKL